MTGPSTADSFAFIQWLLNNVIADGRGDRKDELKVAPYGLFWLGRLAPEEVTRNSRLGERAERLDPCEVGIRLRLSAIDGRPVTCSARLVAWQEIETDTDPDVIKWRKSTPIEVTASLATPLAIGPITKAGRDEFASAFTAVGAEGLACEFRAELETGKDGPELVVSLVNDSPEEIAGWDTNVYEASLEVQAGATDTFTLDNLPDSFRYDCRVAAYGVNCGVEPTSEGTGFRTTDVGMYDQPRPRYWDDDIGSEPNISFATLADDPLPSLRALVEACDRWGGQHWAPSVLASRADDEAWDDEMRASAKQEAALFFDELARLRRGLSLLEENDMLRRAFRLANRAFHESPRIHHTQWRPFQLGFMLASAASITDDSPGGERRFVDTLWFATGGGKTETYLLYVVTAIFYDRLRGKREGITSWGRFPLRMLSLQQTQRFADVLSAAELIRRKESLDGARFSLGFLVGPGTPNSIKRQGRGAHEPDPDDPHMPARYQVLLRCPFCDSDKIEMRFTKKWWTLDHFCTAPRCPWGGDALPFRIVDDEIYRSLPTVVLGTLDKAASVGMQAAMRGFYGAPSGKCPEPGHGFTYAPRADRPSGCLVTGCDKTPGSLPQDPNFYAPTIRMQDELHLLRDSLGAVDSHYEALLDSLQEHYESVPKIIASSATLAGHDEQVDALYRREGRTFPRPGPRAGWPFWSRDSDTLARRFAGLAPRGVTLEYATDQLSEALQRVTRHAVDNPAEVAAELGVDEVVMPRLIENYGVDVVYGSTLKDVEAVARSFDTQILLDPPVKSATLTGRTPLEEVRESLEHLTDPEPDFYDRLHLVAASSMLSHGVDVNRLNVMVMLGLPLSAAEFIQTTSRVGRTHPGLVIVLHKIGRERDAAVYRTFPAFVQHAERLIDPVPVTANSRRVLELTFAGLEQARIYGIHEPAALSAGMRQLTLPKFVKDAFAGLPVTEEGELAALIQMLRFNRSLDESLRNDLTADLKEFYRALNDPAGAAKWVSDLFPAGPPMLSLRDVEEQAPVYTRGGVA